MSWSLINTLATKLMTIGITAFVVRIVSPQDFGVFSAALVAYSIFFAMGEMGLAMCVARRDVNPSEAGPTIFLLSIVTSTVFAAAMAIGAQPVADLLGAPGAVDPIRVLSISIFLSAFTAVPSAVLMRDFRQGRLFAATLISFVPSNAALVLLALNGDGAMAFAWSRLVGQLVAGTVIVLGARQWYLPRWNTAQARIAMVFGVPLAGANLMAFMLMNADYALVGNFLGARMLGIYTLAFNVASWSASAFGGTIERVAMPALSALRSDPEELTRAFFRWLRLIAVAAFPVAALTSMLAPDLIAVLYGRQWGEAAPILSVLAAYGAFSVLCMLPSSLLVALGRTGRDFVVQGIWLVGIIPAMALGVHFFDLEGAAIAHVGVIVVIVIPVYLFTLRKVVPSIFSALWRSLTYPACVACVSAGIAWLAAFAIEMPLARLLAGGAAGGLCAVFLALPLIRQSLAIRIPAALAPVVALSEKWTRRLVLDAPPASRVRASESAEADASASTGPVPSFEGVGDDGLGRPSRLPADANPEVRS